MNWLKVYTFDSLTYIFDITIVTIISMISVLQYIDNHWFDYLSLIGYTLFIQIVLAQINVVPRQRLKHKKNNKNLDLME